MPRLPALGQRCRIKPCLGQGVAAGDLDIHMEESLAPYTRFVRLESERVAQVKELLERLRAQTRDLRQRIDGSASTAAHRRQRIDGSASTAACPSVWAPISPSLAP